MLISAEDEKVYQVVGIKSSMEEMFQQSPMPLMIEAVLMPMTRIGKQLQPASSSEDIFTEKCVHG